MARKNTLQSRIAQNQSLAASFNSPVTVIEYTDNVCYQINVTTSDSEGSFVVQASADYDVNQPGTQVSNPGNWVDLMLAGGTPTVAGANDSILIDLNQLPFKAIRLRYVSSVAGTGTCDIWIVTKQIGG